MVVHKPSEYQQNIYDVLTTTNHNININAVAGSGKTTTLLGILERIPSNKDAVLFAFNTSVVNTLKERIQRNDNIHISTLHSYGLHQTTRKYSKIRVDANKVFAKLGKVFKKYDIPANKQGYFFYNMPKLMNLMRYTLTEPTEKNILELAFNYDINVDEEHVNMIQYLFKQIISDKEVVDFADMIYVPVTDLTLKVNKYDYVLVDESQDMNACQHQLIKKSLKRDSRLITVGDPRQSIYCFAGAHTDSFNKLSSLAGETINLPLSVSYRCPKCVVEEAQKIVPEISYAPEARNGIVRDGSLLELRDGDWILCRNLKPLIETYLWLLKNGIKSKIRGKDIGEGILSLIDKINPQTLGDLEEGFIKERENLYDRLMKKGIRNPSLHPKMELLLQRIEVLEFLMEEVTTVSKLKIFIETIFTDKLEGILLSTIHKSKGLENDTIFFICPELIPSKYATTDEDFKQEENLKYVAITRAKDELVYVHNYQFIKDIKTKI